MFCVRDPEFSKPKIKWNKNRLKVIWQFFFFVFILKNSLLFFACLLLLFSASCVCNFHINKFRNDLLSFTIFNLLFRPFYVNVHNNKMCACSAAQNFYSTFEFFATNAKAWKKTTEENSSSLLWTHSKTKKKNGTKLIVRCETKVVILRRSNFES